MSELGDILKRAFDLSRPYSPRSVANDTIRRFQKEKGQKLQVVYQQTAYDSELPIGSFSSGTVLRMDFHSTRAVGGIRAGTNYAWFVCVRASPDLRTNTVFRIHSRDDTPLGEELQVRSWKLVEVFLDRPSIPIGQSTTLLLEESVESITPIQIAQMYRGSDVLGPGNPPRDFGDPPSGDGLIRVTVGNK